MSAPSAPRGSRGAGRGRVRSNPRPRDGRVDEGEARSTRRTSPYTPSAPSRQRNPPTRANGLRGKSWRQEAGASIPQSQADTSSNVFGLTSSNARSSSNEANTSYKKRMNDLYSTLKVNRERERKDAIKNGFLADPDRPTSLAKAITPVGTCQDMCPRFERIERIVQMMVDSCEKMAADSLEKKEPCEEKMVKRFRRSAAGYDEQLPSDIRPPLVLQKTLNYLFEEVIGGSQSLATVHKFVWDRTRGIRNDFSIQQVTQTEDLRVAIDCFERIARFHILSLHQLSKPGIENGEFDHHQEREQLNNTLLSLMYYYDDSRHKLTSPNEAEFRSYCIIFEIQDQRPDLEDRAQNWPRPLLKDQRIQTAFKLFAAAGNTSNEQGPLRPRTTFSIAQANSGQFWSIVESHAVSYLMACVAEIYFHMVRRTALESVWKAYRKVRVAKVVDWVLGDLLAVLGFDSEDQAQTFCEEHGFVIGEREDGEAYLDVGSVSGHYLSDSNPRRKQIFSHNLVEQKRLGRTLPAVINGLTAFQAQKEGMIDEDHSGTENSSSKAGSESLFMPSGSDEEQSNSESNTTKQKKQSDNSVGNFVNPFGPVPNLKEDSTAKPSLSTLSNSPFGKPSIFFPGTESTSNTNSTSTFAKPTPFSSSQDSPSIFTSGNAAATNSDPFKTAKTPKFDFFPTSNTKNEDSNPFPPPISNTSPQPNSIFSQPSTSIPKTTPKSPYSFGTSSLFNKAVVNPVSNNEIQGSTDSVSKDSDPKRSTSSSSLFPISSNRETSSILTSLPTTIPAKSPSSIFSSQTSSNSLFPPSTLSSTNFPATSIPTPPPPSSTFPIPDNITTTLPPSTITPSSHENSTLKFPFPPTNFTIPTPTSVENAGTVSKLTRKQSSIPTESTLPPSPSLFQPPRSPSTPTLPPVQQARAGRPKIDPRPAALESLSRSLLLDDEGLLQQFIEYSVGPIIKSAFSQVKNERSWKKADEYRQILLSKKYVRRWRNNAWKLGLLRKGRERRKNFARSMQDMAHSERRPQKDTDQSGEAGPKLQGGLDTNQQRAQEHQDMPPPSKPRAKKRRSLPADFEPSRSEDSDRSANSKRQRLDSSQNEKSPLPRHLRAHHERSNTLGSSSTRNLLLSSKVKASSLSNDPRLGESLIRQARHLVSGPTDTTRTDYFRLKAMGINPDTPLIPATRQKRPSSNEDLHPHKISKSSPTNPSSTTSNAAFRHTLTHPPNPSLNNPSPSPADDEDEALFAEIRRVREAMAEGISWYQSERAKSERATPTSSSSTGGGGGREAKPETEKQRRLREWTSTPSRTEQRLRATGAKGLLPKDFWTKSRGADGGMGTQDGTLIGRQGFAAFDDVNRFGAVSDGGGGKGVGGKGASVEDAIEL